jgi:microcystin-dependent protein
MWPPETKSYLEDFISTVLPTSAAFQVLAQKMAYPIGVTPRVVMEDLTANTGEYVWQDPVTGLGYLYCNGAAVSKTTYADLYAVWGASKWAADVGATFILPDTRGRSLFLAGTNANATIADTDGVTESSRQPKHTHTVSGAPGVGTLGVSDSGHTHGAGSYALSGSYVISGALSNTSGGGNAMDYQTNPAVGGTSASATTGVTISGAPSVGSLAAGSGMSGSDAVAHIVIGSLVIRY